MNRWGRHLLAVAALAIGACNVESRAGDTGGATLGPGGFCPRGLAMISSDRASSNVGLLSVTGETLSASLLSSGSKPVGIAQILSGDVVLPQAPPPSGEVVLIDRFPNAVLTFVHPETGVIRGQLSVATGFPSNPHDYLEVGPRKAYVSRYGDNGNAGREPLDTGSDLLVIDPMGLRLDKSIPLPKRGPLLPRPDRMLKLPQRAEVWVTLQRFNVNFRTLGPAELAGIDADTDTLRWTMELGGAQNCGAMAISPSGKRVVVACSGPLIDNRTSATGSALVVLDTSTSPPAIQRVIPPRRTLDSVFAQGLGFANENVVVGVTYGDKVAGKTDRVYTTNIVSGEQRMLLDAGAAFVLGDDVRCLGECADRCFVPNAARGVLLVLRSDGSIGPEVPLRGNFGLPPRSLSLL